ncbi:hypothetical protein MMC07_002731 [Pseudocyphellaria aurata]|nr:hypothetical protein [Pseudocyphellaria aurata]
MPTTVTSKEWEERKSRIEKLYVEKGYTLRVVRKKMETSHFQPSESQYRTRFKIWGSRKARKDRRITSNSSARPVHASSPANDIISSQEAEAATYSSAKPQPSISETSFYECDQWSPDPDYIDSARVSEAPPNSHLNSAVHSDAANFPDSYWTLSNGSGPSSDFSPLLLPFDEQSAYDTRPIFVSADSHGARTSLQLHKPFTARSQSTTSQRKQPAGTFIESPVSSGALTWMHEEELQDGLSPFCSAPEEIPDNLNLNDFPYPT